MDLSGELAGPFRWDLVTPDQLGSLLDGVAAPDLWFLDGLVGCAGKVVARSGGGDLVFVGRSLDSMFDFLSGAFAGLPDPQRLGRLPLSFARTSWSARGWVTHALAAGDVTRAREFLAALEITPDSLARRSRPVTFVDVVWKGSTFTDVFELVRGWVDDERGSWPVLRRKLRFVGVTMRTKTSPKTWRWQQHVPWTAQLPASAVVNVSLSRGVWSYFGDNQTKLTRTFRPEQWRAEADGPGRDERTRVALAEAVTLVAHGRSRTGRHALARAIAGAPALSEPWLRTLVRQLNHG
ncbi:hypothetical protein [Parafrankia elaeagni]|uniref:hypothetical protein n=1 Tax=Parafrankia elaeagni TaxID=222534 RepID=UPI0004765C4D|nr:hypothetical protein [Parafrankia elaeagni]